MSATIHPSDNTIPMDNIIHDLEESHKRTTQGTWQKGDTTHMTVAVLPDGKHYSIADFRHADDAQFCDLAHAFVPILIAEIRRLRAGAELVEIQSGV